MSENQPERCIVRSPQGEIEGTIVNKYEEVGGPDDGAIFAVINLDNGQVITVRMSELFPE